MLKSCSVCGYIHDMNKVCHYKKVKKKTNANTFRRTYQWTEKSKSIRKRDKNDMQKEMGALKIAEGAVVIDTTHLTPEEVFEKIKELVENQKYGGK